MGDLHPHARVVRLDGHGNLQHVICTYHDITERKQAEEAPRASEERWATTLQSIGDAVISTCAEGKIIFMNEVAEKLTGWPLPEAKERHLDEVFKIVQEDNGRGIPAELREKIFDPFFTTKGESGAGLGLWITADVIRKYEGTIRLRSTTRPGRSSTCFSVFFPLESSAT